MKPTQRRRYADRIDRVVQHLDGLDVDALPDLAQLARIAAMSPFHFHRIFRLMTGETVAQMLRRLRLARAVPVLGTAAPVTAAAGASGYASSQSFARALRAQAGLSASAARSADADLDALAQTLQRSGADAATPLRIDIVSLAPFRVLAIRNVGAYEELNAGYGRLFEQVLAQVAPEQIRGIWGIPREDPRFVAPETFVFDCALDLGDAGHASGDLHELRIRGGRCLRLRHVGSFDALPGLIDQLYARLLDDEELEPADAPLLIHYLDDPEQVTEADLRSDGYLPLAG